MNDEFETWAKENHCLTESAWKAWQAATMIEREACAKWLDDEADRQELAWSEYLSSGKQGPATSLHGIPRGYAEKLRMRSNV